MCGIAGILAPGDGQGLERALRAMTSALAARGPDGEGFLLAPPMGLGHRRLAIIDVDGGKQPLFSEDGNVVAVVNGEIYNFVELRRALEQAGHRFATRSDSEVVVHAYEEWGDGFLEQVEGMFALAVWEARAQRLLLARDRMGEKPLYWTELPRHGLAFASELKALRHVPGLDARIDPNSLARYLVYEYVPSPATILRGARKLEPGTSLTIRAGEAPRVWRYWDLPIAKENDARVGHPEQAAEILRSELRRSVKERLVSDVPLGIFLSGGLDSSAIAALAAQARGGDIDTFSLGFDVPSFDESGEARRVAQAISSRHHEERISARALLELLPMVGGLLDEPLGDGSIVPTHLLARFTRRHVTVALGGDGGDELFFGYPTFQAERVAQAIFDRTPRPLASAAATIASGLASALPVSTRYMSLDFKLKQFLKGMALSGAHRHQAWLGSLAPADAVAALSEDVAREVGGDLHDVIDERLARSSARDPWDRLMVFYARGYLGDDVLTKVDRATMAVGLEARAPLLDRRIIELACRLALPLRMRGFDTKHLLKRAMKGILPNKTISRRKQGFAMPIGHWLKTELRPLMEADLATSRLRDEGLFSPQPVRRLVDEHVSGQADHRKPLWTLIAFQRWWQSWRTL
ncbi:MAG: asparagine synthase (glutamine-hydrolyzing) [Deltaproteobacteria bacterium]|nr:asparagine synthase (glutamine-hydrolyzing) [Deltaproteobacteria bacterium]